MNLKLSKPVALLAGIGIASIPSSIASDCHESCATCTADAFGREDFCLTCADGSPVTTKSEEEDWGFCGSPCTLCYDNLDPAYPDNTYFRASDWIEDGVSNCSSDVVMMPWLIKDSHDMCHWVQRNTYLQCGCPTLPLLLTSSNNPTPEPCKICADGSQPLNPNTTVVVDGTFAGSFETTCALLADAFSHPRLGAVSMSSPLTRESLECPAEQYKYYEKCGCPKPEVPKDGCTLCVDGAPVDSSYSSAIVMSEGRPVDSENSTCSEMEERAPFSGTEKDTWLCNDFYNSWGAESCGCAPVQVLSSLAFAGKNTVLIVWSIAVSTLLIAVHF